jgi:5-methylcytosine-specific restriction endonuclease McrA
MSDYAEGSLATMLVDLLTSEPWQPDLVHEPIVYHVYIKSDEWKVRAKAARFRAHYRCQLCDIPGDDFSLKVHHNNYDHLGDEWESDLIALCDDCHSRHHGRIPNA